VPLETATYISQLVPANPASADALATTQNHLNLIKSVLQTQFPNLGAAPVAATAADLTAGIGGAVATLMANSVTLNPSGSALQTIAGPVAVNGTFNAVTIQQNGVALVPSGLIAMWSGSASAIPAGWLLCNGASGTPNLEGMFVLGAGGAYGVGATGGAASASPTTSSAGSHNHGGQDLIAGPFGMTGSSDVQGTHSHGGATAGATLSVADLPAHNHNISTQGASVAAGANAITVIGSGGTYGDGYTGSGSPHAHTISADGAHSHNISVSNAPAHQHGISADGTHSHSVTVPTIPPFYALCFIMKS
jgi:hypothetical protein